MSVAVPGDEPMRGPASFHLRHAMIGVAVIAASLAAARAWDFHRRAPASAALIDPLIRFHVAHEADARERLAMSTRLAWIRLAGLVRMGRPPWALVVLVPPGAGRLRATSGLRDAICWIQDIRPARWSRRDWHGLTQVVRYWRLGEFHRTALAHYLELKSEHVVAMPGYTPEVQAALDRAEAAARRDLDSPDLDLYPETAPHLRPGAPSPRPGPPDRIYGDPTGHDANSI